jgi:hypothetical protein
MSTKMPAVDVEENIKKLRDEHRADDPGGFPSPGYARHLRGV